MVLDSEDAAFTDGFRRLFGDCIDTSTDTTNPQALVEVREDGPGTVVVHIPHPAGVDLARFFELAFAERGCRRLTEDAGGVHLTCANPAVDFRVCGPRVHFRVDQDWQGLAANLAMGLVMREQPTVVFLHAGAVALADTWRGIVLVGPKSSGKTTLSLGLGLRGHRFLGDEMVGIRFADASLLPIRRAISKRPGPCAAGVEQALAGRPLTQRVYPDGQTRTVVTASDLFGTLPDSAALHAVVFLRGFGDEPMLTPVAPSMSWAAQMTPVMNTIEPHAAGARAFALLRLLGRAQVYTLQVGPPEATCEMIEQTLAAH